jgi:hypothetical protein
MDPGKPFVDERLLGRCAYCGGAPETRDHVPPKIFLDDPLPENLPVVDACLRCNSEASADEQYLACLLDCVVTGSACPCKSHREKVRSTLEKRPALQSFIDAGRRPGLGGGLLWTPDPQRVENIILKLARGHIAYEYSETQHDEPEYVEYRPLPWNTDLFRGIPTSSVEYRPLPLMSAEEIRSFEQNPLLQAWPEIGSRAFIRAVVATGVPYTNDGWQVIQEARYRYTVSCTPAIQVKFVLGEYLACEVGW